MTTTPITTPAASAPRLTPALALRDFAGIARRNLLRSVRTPQLVLYWVQPILMLLLFRYIFAGAIRSANYAEFVIPAIWLITVQVGGMTAAIGIAEDLKSGMIDRFRSLPMARSAVLTGRSLTDLARNAISLAIMIGLGVATGFRFHAGAGAIITGLLLILAFGYAFGWMNTAIGISAKDPESAQNAATGPVFLLLFASNAIVPVQTLPGWLQAFARNQPLGVTTSAIRALLTGSGPAAGDAWISLAWSAGITLVFFVISYTLYQRAAAR